MTLKYLKGIVGYSHPNRGFGHSVDHVINQFIAAFVLDVTYVAISHLNVLILLAKGVFNRIANAIAASARNAVVNFAMVANVSHAIIVQ